MYLYDRKKMILKQTFVNRSDSQLHHKMADHVCGRERGFHPWPADGRHVQSLSERKAFACSR
jgi:hypothetical protein